MNSFDLFVINLPDNDDPYDEYIFCKFYNDVLEVDEMSHISYKLSIRQSQNFEFHCECQKNPFDLMEEGRGLDLKTLLSDGTLSGEILLY